MSPTTSPDPIPADPSASGQALTATRRWRRPSINITDTERVGRVLLGLVAICAGVILLASGVSVLAIVLELLLIAAGLDLAVTGALGHCPLYAKLGHVPASLRRSP